MKESFNVIFPLQKVLLVLSLKEILKFSHLMSCDILQKSALEFKHSKVVQT